LATGAVLVLLSFALIALPAGYGQWIGNHGDLLAHWNFPRILRQSFPYIRCVFYGYPTPAFYMYPPIWGGFLNPVTGTLALLGYAFSLRSLQDRYHRWMVFAVPVLFLPGIFSSSLETYRILLVGPLLCFLAADALVRLMRFGRPAVAVTLAVLIVAASTGLDQYHLFVKYREFWAAHQNRWGFEKNWSYYRAYGILDAQRKARGPGLILTGFAPNTSPFPMDLTLTTAVRSFNRAHGSWEQEASWGALVASKEALPQLRRLDPGGRATDISSPQRGFPSMVLWISDLTVENRGIWGRWRAADADMLAAIEEAIHCPMSVEGYRVRLADLKRLKPVFATDPFLFSCYRMRLSEMSHWIDELFSGSKGWDLSP